VEELRSHLIQTHAPFSLGVFFFFFSTFVLFRFATGRHGQEQQQIEASYYPWTMGGKGRDMQLGLKPFSYSSLSSFSPFFASVLLQLSPCALFITAHYFFFHCSCAPERNGFDSLAFPVLPMLQTLCIFSACSQ
jgi:hypothetical protein